MGKAALVSQVSMATIQFHYSHPLGLKTLDRFSTVLEIIDLNSTKDF